MFAIPPEKEEVKDEKLQPDAKNINNNNNKKKKNDEDEDDGE